jgi:hypothetical protein
MTDSVTFTLEKLERLRIRYAQARLKNEEWFVFDGNEYVTNYAKYLIEYIEKKLGKP